jgi:hypothetical protein
MFTDQIWINFVPLFFKKVHVLMHPGYNMAYWNLHERKLTKANNQYLVNDREKLVFFHYSGFKTEIPNTISKYQNRFTFEDKIELFEIFQLYANYVESNNHKFYQKFTCYYFGLKEKQDDERVLEIVKSIPLFKRFARKIINTLVNKFDIILDYSVFYDRHNLKKDGK